MRWRAVLGGALVLVLLSAVGHACQLPAGWLAMATEKPSFRAAISVGSKAIAIGEPFAVEFAVCASDGRTAERVAIDATMPAHRHGMNYRPTVSVLGDGRYRAEAFLFHMPGLWEVVVTAYRGGQPVHLKREFQVQ